MVHESMRELLIPTGSRSPPHSLVPGAVSAMRQLPEKLQRDTSDGSKPSVT